ncbi:MAG TPA: NAD(P)-dependent alcohol dehydrogenase [Atribacterota bacterium]|nr:NAD(P)-dependent alcohol dehydrogenase [Atribacterota bacterium]
MKAVILNKTKDIAIVDDFLIEEYLGPNDVRIAVKHVGICGSDVHYYEEGKIGPYIITEPMVLGHEASGIVIEVGKQVTHLVVGDRVCMEPGIPDFTSKASRLGMYNLDPNVRFWATPPIHGCLRESVVHPASLTFKVPDSVSLEEAAMVEPMAIGIYAATKAQIKPGDIALVLGAGTIGIVTTLAVLAGGCSKVIVSDIQQPKLDLIRSIAPVKTVNITKNDLADIVAHETNGWGVDIVFEASGNKKAFSTIFHYVCPGGKVVIIGIPSEPALFDVPAAQAKEAITIPIFRYANMYPKTLALLESGKVDLKPCISRRFPFSKAIEAFELAAKHQPDIVKIQIYL